MIKKLFPFFVVACVAAVWLMLSIMFSMSAHAQFVPSTGAGAGAATNIPTVSPYDASIVVHTNVSGSKTNYQVQAVGAASTNLVGTNGLATYPGAGSTVLISPALTFPTTNTAQLENYRLFVAGLQRMNMWTNLSEAIWLATNQNSATAPFYGLKGSTFGWAGASSNQWNGLSTTASGLQSTNFPTISGPATVIVFFCGRGWAQNQQATIAGLYADNNTPDGALKLCYSGGALALEQNNSANGGWLYNTTFTSGTNDVTPRMAAFSTDRITALNQYTDAGDFASAGISTALTVNFTSFVLGAAPSGTGSYLSNYNGVFYGAAVFNTALTSNQIYSFYALAKQTMLPWQNTVWEGDSHLAFSFTGAVTAGSPSGHTETNWPLWSLGKISMCGYGGKTMPQMTNSYLFTVQTNAPNGADIRYVVPMLWEGGRNSIETIPSLAIYQAASNECYNAHQAGFLYGMSTVIHSYGDGIYGYTYVDTYDNFVRSNTAGADFIVDQDRVISNAANSLEPGIGPRYWTNDATLGTNIYWTDQLHLANGGIRLYGSNQVAGFAPFLPNFSLPPNSITTQAQGQSNLVQAVIGGAFGGSFSADPTFDSVTATNATRGFISQNAVANFTAEADSSHNGNYQFVDTSTGNFYNLLMAGADDSWNLLVKYGSAGLASALSFQPAGNIWTLSGTADVTSWATNADAVLSVNTGSNGLEFVQGTGPTTSGGSQNNQIGLYGTTNAHASLFTLFQFLTSTPGLATWSLNFPLPVYDQGNAFFGSGLSLLGGSLTNNNGLGYFGNYMVLSATNTSRWATNGQSTPAGWDTLGYLYGNISRCTGASGGGVTTFATTNINISQGTAFSFAISHGLGYTPTNGQAFWLVCTTNDSGSGMTVGQRTPATSIVYGNNGSQIFRVVMDSSHVTAIYNGQSGSCDMPINSGYATTVNLSNFALQAVVW